MNHPTEEQLILHYYGEEPAGLERHFAECEACRGEYRRLQRVLNTVESLPVPERTAEYGAEVWNRIRPQIGAPARRGWRAWFEWRRLAVAAAMACLLVLAFVAGRYGHAPAAETGGGLSAGPRANPAGSGRRSSGAFADGAGRVVEPGAGRKGRIDISYEQRAAEDLVDSSRLYRMSANRSGERATASLLDELERVLLDVAHGPSEVSEAQLEDLQKRISDAGILFKVRVYASHMDRRGADNKVLN